MEIETIDRDELKTKLDRGDDFALVMTLADFAYRAAHIPGSLHYHTVEDAFEGLKPDQEIVVSCSDEACVASQYADKALRYKVCSNVRRYSGGLSDWQDAGYPLEGESVPR